MENTNKGLKIKQKIFIFAMSLFLFASSFVLSAKAENIVPDGVEHVGSFDVFASINSNATVSITETINYNFGNQVKAGFVRYIPLNYQNLDGKKISVNVSDVTITDDGGNPIVFNQSKFKSEDKKKTYLQIVVGDEGGQISGSKKYVIRYTISGAIKTVGENAEFFWDITGDKWPVYVAYPEVKISLPQKVEKENISKECFVGLHEATITCIDRLGSKKDFVSDYSYKGVVAGESMITVLKFPKELTKKEVASSQTFWEKLKTNSQIQAIFVALGLVLIGGIVFVRKYFKEIKQFFAGQKIKDFLLALGKKIKLHRVHAHARVHAKKLKNKSRKWWMAALAVLVLIAGLGSAVFWKIESTLNKISTKGESVGSIVQAGFDSQAKIKGEDDGRINVLLLGVLGANHPGGGLNTDTIMVASIKPQENKISLVSIPRDLWVVDPGKDTKSKINAVYVYGEEKGAGQGIGDMETLVGEITGLPIHYTAMVSTQGFAQLVDTLGGVDIELTKPFDETAQFDDVSVCDSGTYTIPTGEFQVKKNKKKKVTAEYPLCKNNNPECGGDFHLPAGKNTLSGQQALCFARSRYLTSDFERAKRQQLIINQFKNKATQVGLLEFGKINSILNDLGDNVKTDMQFWEMRRMFDIYKGMDNPKIYQRVLEDSKEGLLYSPDKSPETGYILLPRGDNYDKIKELFQNIFNTSSQSDIKPKI